jgi:hypothetical protein
LLGVALTQRALMWLQDFLQLLRPGVALVRKDGRQAIVETEGTFIKENAFHPRYFADFQALAGACTPLIRSMLG